MPGTFLALSSRMLWRVLEKRDIDPVFVFREAGLDPAFSEQFLRFIVAEVIQHHQRIAEGEQL